MKNDEYEYFLPELKNQTQHQVFLPMNKISISNFSMASINDPMSRDSDKIYGLVILAFNYFAEVHQDNSST